jgi:hypothetical protein
MTDEYICKDCGHRAGDHAVNNRCLNCDCVADPYLEQLVALRKQLDIAVEALKEVVLGKAGINLSANSIRRYDIEIAENALAEIEKIGGVNDTQSRQ